MLGFKGQEWGEKGPSFQLTVQIPGHMCTCTGMNQPLLTSVISEYSFFPPSHSTSGLLSWKKHNSKYVIKVCHKTADVSVNTPSENINVCVNSWTVYLNRILNLETKRIQNSFPSSASQTRTFITYSSGRLNSEYCTSRGILLQSRSFIIKVGQVTMPPFTPHTGFLQTSSIVQCSIKEKNHHRSQRSCFYWELTTPPPPLSFPGTRVTDKHPQAQRWFWPTEACIGTSPLGWPDDLL